MIKDTVLKYNIYINLLKLKKQLYKNEKNRREADQKFF